MITDKMQVHCSVCDVAYTVIFSTYRKVIAEGKQFRCPHHHHKYNYPDVMVKTECPVCGKKFELRYKNYVRKAQRGGKALCSQDCARKFVSMGMYIWK